MAICQQMANVSITVKNTFVNVKRQAESPVAARRSSSVPRTFKLGDHHVIKSTFATAPPSDASTSAHSASKPCSDCDSQDLPDHHIAVTDDEYLTDDEFDFMPAGPELCRPCYVDFSSAVEDKSRVTLSLSAMVTEGATEKTKLRPTAMLFKSVRTPPAEVNAVLAAAVEVLSSGTNITDVQVHDGGMGGTTMIVATSSSPDPDATWTAPLVKDALLTAAEHSENTYILGYGSQPFNTLDALSFSFNVGQVPAAHQDTACWDTYEKGYCPRCTTCRWDHPAEVDTMRVVVMIKCA